MCLVVGVWGKASTMQTVSTSRILPDKGGFSQAYNAQAAVDEKAQVIIACSITQQSTDKQQLLPVLKCVQENTGQLPEKTSADSGYFASNVVEAPERAATDLYVPPDRQKHGTGESIELTATQAKTEASQRMRAKLQTDEGRAIYNRRKAIVEPVFGQIKEARGIRRFSLRGLEKVAAEWSIICWTHNLLKLFRSGAAPKRNREADGTQTGKGIEVAENRNSGIERTGSVFRCLFPVPGSLFPVCFSPTRS